MHESNRSSLAETIELASVIPRGNIHPPDFPSADKRRTKFSVKDDAIVILSFAKNLIQKENP